MVPLGRAPATEVYSPLRSFHASARSAASSDSTAGERRASSASSREPGTTSSSSPAWSGAWYSISSAASCFTSKPRICGGASAKLWPTRRLAASISSSVAAFVSTSAGSARAASSRVANTASVVAIFDLSGTVT